MNQVTPAALALAQWLLALEATDENGRAGTMADAAGRVLDKMRASLTKLIGVAGFQALANRALALAKADVSWLRMTRVGPEGTLEGLGEAAQGESATAAANGYATLLAHLLSLLISFIGEDLTVRLVRDVWPEASLDAPDFGAKDTPE